ncbi:MAG: hypothetical protein ACYC59_03670 [Anaerolineaceae bacterium]
MQIEDGSGFSEGQIINILIEVVGTDKMYNLIADIFASKGLMGNVNPTVVFEKNKYYVYDGNRRISSLKILKNPILVEDETLRAKIIQLVNNKDVSFVNSVFVYIADKKEALELMDKIHSGEQEGVGIIPWEAYQRDTSLNRRSIQVRYPNAFKIAEVLQLNKKSQFKIPYTDLDRLFSSKTLQKCFGLPGEVTEFKSKVEFAIGMLLNYKGKMHFQSFSRHFNITDATVSDAPIAKFCDWVKEQEKTKNNFYFSTTSIELFEDENFSFEMLHLQIFDAQNREICYQLSNLAVSYISPNGIDCSSIDMTETGDWTVHITYKEAEHTDTIIVKKLLAPKIDFISSQTIIGLRNTLNLRDIILRAKNGHDDDVKKRVLIVGVNGTEVIGDVFNKMNNPGKHLVAYSFTDITGEPFSVTREIEVIDESSPLYGIDLTSPLLSFNGSSTGINVSEIVNEMVNEINNLDLLDNLCIITTALRTLMELTFDELQIKGKIKFSKVKDLEKCIEEFKIFLLNGALTTICNNNSNILTSYHNEKNCVNLFDPEYLASYLNLATHKSIARIDVTKIKEIATKFISPLLIYATLILK